MFFTFWLVALNLFVEK